MKRCISACLTLLLLLSLVPVAYATETETTVPFTTAPTETETTVLAETVETTVATEPRETSESKETRDYYLFTGSEDDIGYLDCVLPDGSYHVTLILADGTEHPADNVVVVNYDNDGCCICAASGDFLGEHVDLTFAVITSDSETALYFGEDSAYHLYTGAQIRFDPTGDDVSDVYQQLLDKLVNRPFMTTPFEEYTVSEGFLLLIFLVLFLSFVLKICWR